MSRTYMVGLYHIFAQENPMKFCIIREILHILKEKAGEAGK
jgi:hypothetical protein